MQSSTNSLRTLKGVFDVPKMNHRRDFLRENKLNLRELQKNTSQKLTQQKVEQERQQRKHLHRYQKSQEHYVAARRSDSQQRYDDEEVRRNHQTRAAGGGAANLITGAGDGGRKNAMPFRRSYSQQRESRENVQPSYPAGMHEAYANHTNSSYNRDSKETPRVPRSASVASIISKAESCDKEIQTEDIIDEEFLYDALKKCSSTEIDFRRRHIRENDHSDTNLSKSNVSLHSQPLKYEDNKSTHSREHIQFDYREHNIPPTSDNKNYHEQYTERSEYSQMQNGHHNHHMQRSHQQDEENERYRENYHNTQYNKQESREYEGFTGASNRQMKSNHMLTRSHHQQQTEEQDHLGEHFQNLHIDPHAPREYEAQSSGRSRQTMMSTMSKKKSNGNYKLGNREDLRLPRYLEKEKREKEEERARQMSRDPNCPLGHYALAEEERLAALNAAQKKMASLIQELNRMPMTTETLRIRSRKVEIEKELSQIELDIRTFSKPKVYIASEPPASVQY